MCTQTNNNVLVCEFLSNNNYILYDLLTIFTAYDELVSDVFLSKADYENLKPVFKMLAHQVNDLITSMM